MSWDNRSVSVNPPKATLDILRSQTDVIELSSSAEHRYGPKGPLTFDRLIGAGVQAEFIGRTAEDFPALREWLSNADDLVLGHFTYEVKDLLEPIRSECRPRVEFPLFRFFIPEHTAILDDGGWTLRSHSPLQESIPKSPGTITLGPIHSGMDMVEYHDRVGRIMRHIQLGDIYETNFCVEHFATETVIDPAVLFGQMVADGKAPFSCRMAHGGRHLLCASPERFMAKVGNRIFSQPMKGTNRRQPDNAAAMEALRNDPKERAENIMITDLVRNDLSKFAKQGSVKVDELCGVHSFAHVNQMVSTVSCELRDGVHPLDMLLGAYPMGSMTGAPKVRAMQIIDEYEGFGRGLFSGSVGYFTPDLDFDFNVVIRSILYDENSKNLSFPTGSAITINSDPQREWEECLLKSEAMRRLLKEHAGQGS